MSTGLGEYHAFATTHLERHPEKRLQLLDLAAVEALLSGIIPCRLRDASRLRDPAEVTQAVKGQPTPGKHLVKHTHKVGYLTIIGLTNPR